MTNSAMFLATLIAVWCLTNAGEFQEDGYVEPPPQKQAYAFGYDIKDGHGNSQSRHEESDEYGNKRGSYGYTDAWGVYRVVEYVADHKGFRAWIRTNEPGTSNQSPADVKVQAEPPPVTHKVPSPPIYSHQPEPVYAPAPALHHQQDHDYYDEGSIDRGYSEPSHHHQDQQHHAYAVQQDQYETKPQVAYVQQKEQNALHNVAPLKQYYGVLASGPYGVDHSLHGSYGQKVIKVAAIPVRDHHSGAELPVYKDK